MAQGRLVFTAVLGVVMAMAAGASAQGQRPGVAQNRCLIADRLEQLRQSHAGNSRFLAVEAADRPDGYVQCLFLPDRKQLLCEAASGYYAAGQPDLAGNKGRKILASTGFNPDARQGNYQRVIAVDNKLTLDALAGDILMLLRDVYGADDASTLTMVAPVLGDKDGAPQRCRAVG